MKKPRNESASANAFLATIAVLFLGLLVLYLSAQFVPRGRMMMDYVRDYAGLQLLFSSFNVLLLLYLFYIYSKDYFELKSAFTGGLLLFLVAMLLFSLTSNPLVHLWYGYRMGPDDFNLVPLVFSTLALLVLAKISAE